MSRRCEDKSLTGQGWKYLVELVFILNLRIWSIITEKLLLGLGEGLGGRRDGLGGVRKDSFQRVARDEARKVSPLL